MITNPERSELLVDKLYDDANDFLAEETSLVLYESLCLDFFADDDDISYLDGFVRTECSGANLNRVYICKDRVHETQEDIYIADLLKIAHEYVKENPEYNHWRGIDIEVDENGNCEISLILSVSPTQANKLTGNQAGMWLTKTHVDFIANEK